MDNEEKLGISHETSLVCKVDNKYRQLCLDLVCELGYIGQLTIVNINDKYFEVHCIGDVDETRFCYELNYEIKIHNDNK